MAGESESIHVDTAQLDAATAQQVEELVHNMRFFQLPAFVPTGAVGADLYRHEILVIDRERQHTVTFETFDQHEVIPEAEPLLRLRDKLIDVGGR